MRSKPTPKYKRYNVGPIKLERFGGETNLPITIGSPIEKKVSAAWEAEKEQAMSGNWAKDERKTLVVVIYEA